MVKTKKIFIIMLAVICIFNVFYAVFAEEGGTSNPNFAIENFESDSSQAPDEVTGLAKDTLGALIAATRVASVGAMIIMIVVIAIKYMISSAGDRADIKKHAVAFVIGALIIFCSTFIIELLIDLAGEIDRVETT